MSRSKPNLGEPYQIYTEVMNVGKNVEGSKRKIRWLFGFTEKEGEIEVALIHSVTSGKKTIFEDGKEIVSSTNRLATDFGHTWRSETCQGRLFRVEFATSFTTDPTIYTFTVDGIKFIDMPKKGTIGGGGGGGGGASFANKNRSINGFGTGAGSAADSAPSHSHSQSQGHHAPASRAPSGTTSGFGQQSHSQPAPVASSSRRFVYDDDEEDTATSTAPKAHSTPAGAAPRANFQSPFAPTNTATNAGFGFDPFDESPAPAPTAKPTATASLFDAFDEPAPQPKAQPQPAAKKASGTFDAFGSDPFANSSDPFSSPAPAPAPQRAQAQGHAQPARAAAPANKASPAAAGGAAPAPKSVPNFMDDDFSAAPVAPPAAQANNDFGNFGPATHTTPQRRSSAIEISNDFAGLTFAAPAPAPAPVMQTPPPAPVAVAAPAPEPVSNDPWSQSNLVNLDLSGNSKPVKRPSATAAGPSLSSMMHVAPTNSRASFTAGSPSAMTPAGGMSGGPHMGQPLGQPLQPMQPMGHQHPPQQGMYGQPPHQQQQGHGMGLGAQQPMSMGGAPQMGMGQGMGGMNNAAPRASFNAGPMAMGGAPNGNMGAMGGGMQNTRGSFIAANPTPGMGGYGAPGQGLGQPAQPPKSSLDTLDWNF